MSDIVLTKPTAYIYNGYRLPELTCLGTYPYVIIYKTSLSSYIAYCSTQALTIGVSSSDSTQYTLIQKGTRCDFNINTRTQTDWQVGTVYETDRTGSLTSSFGTPIWSSHKLTYPNGNTYIAASKSPSALYEGNTKADDSEFDLYSFNVGLVFGLTDDLDLIDPSMLEEDDYVPPVREPVAYMYNGVRLPPLPEVDREKYPYVYISYYSSSNKDIIRVVFAETILYNDTIGRRVHVPSGAGLEGFYNGGDDWKPLKINESVMNHYLSDLIWANFVVLNKDESIYLAPTIPMPIYENAPAVYLYNGVQLPPLPEWDMASYPYAIITTAMTGSSYNLRFYKTVNYFSSTANLLYFGGDGNNVSVPCVGCSMTKYDAIWGELRTFDNQNSSVPKAIWSNFDMEYEGTLYLAASEPIPVYE